MALGGGSIGDVVGFIASIFKRGINFINIPTTLLAQVDSAIGGKTGVNSNFGKNLIGSFYQPKVVIINTSALKSLSKRQFLSGYSEVVKYALLGDKKFFVQHIVEPHRLEAPLRERLNRVQPDVVVFGHTHKPFCETVNGILFLNPGSVTRPRGQHPPSLVRLTIESDELKPQFIEL